MPRSMLAALVGLITLVIGAGSVRAASSSTGAGMFASGYALPQVSADAKVVVRGPFADAVITQTFKNELDRAVEAIYVFPLPADAAVRSMTIRTGDRTITAKIAPRDQARARYEEAVAAGATAAMTEQERSDVFTQTVAGIEPGAEVKIELRFDLGLTRWKSGWELVLPLVVGPRHVPGDATGAPSRGTGSATDTDQAPDASRITPPVRGDGGGNPITVKVTLPAGVSVDDVEVPSHDAKVRAKKGVVTATVRDARSDRDLVIRWRAAASGAARVFAESDPGGDGAVVALVVEAPRRDVARDKRRWLLALDLSGSVDGDAVVVVREAARALVAAVGDDPVAVLGLGKDDLKWAKSAKDRAALTKRLAAAEAGGSTALTDLLVGALTAADGDDVAIVLITDGLVADDARLVAQVAGATGRLHVIGVGAAPNRGLLGELARRGRGTAVVLGAGDDVDEAVGDLVMAAAAPVVVPAIDWGGLSVRDVAPAVLPPLAPGRSIVIAARVDALPSATTAIRATLGAAAVEAKLSDDTRGADGLVTRRWARARIEDLVATGGAAAEVQRLGLAHELVTPETALIAVGEEVVVEGGVKTTVSIPVAQPAGMRWQAVFGPNGDTGGTLDHADPTDVDTSVTGGAGSGDIRDGDGADDDEETRRPAADMPTPTAVGGSSYGYDSAESVLVHGRVLSLTSTWTKSLSLGGGLHLRGDDRGGELTVEAAAYRGVSERLQVGLVGSLQLAPGIDGGTDGAAYLSSRLFLGPRWMPVIGLELGVGPSLDTLGVAWRAGLRLGPWRLAPVLRVDQTWVDRDDEWRARTSVGGGVEWSF